MTANPREVIGANNPPEPIESADPTPFEIAEKAIEEIYTECKMWMDGAPVENQGHADGIANLLTMIRAAEKQADESRKAEKAPLDKLIDEIQSRYLPLIGDTKAVKGKTVIAAAACKKALAPWLQKQADAITEKARLAREEADAKRLAAETALRMSDATNIAERAAAETLVRAAKKADTAASVAARQTATAGSGIGRAIGLRTSYRHEITDATAFARWLWLNDRAALDEFLNERARQMVRNGQRAIPGVTVHEEKAAA